MTCETKQPICPTTLELGDHVFIIAENYVVAAMPGGQAQLINVNSGMCYGPAELLCDVYTHLTNGPRSWSLVRRGALYEMPYRKPAPPPPPAPKRADGRPVGPHASLNLREGTTLCLGSFTPTILTVIQVDCGKYVLISGANRWNGTVYTDLRELEAWLDKDYPNWTLQSVVTRATYQQVPRVK